MFAFRVRHPIINGLTTNYDLSLARQCYLMTLPIKHVQIQQNQHLV